jgi:hypothetical protein
MIALLVTPRAGPAPAAATVLPTSGLFTSEAGLLAISGTATFEVVLDTMPFASVAMNVTSSDTGEGVVSISALVFATGNWDSFQTVTVTGVGDNMVDAIAAYQINLGLMRSSDSRFHGVVAGEVELTNTPGTCQSQYAYMQISLVECKYHAHGWARKNVHTHTHTHTHTTNRVELP